jgi:hypothetical protein
MRIIFPYGVAVNDFSVLRVKHFLLSGHPKSLLTMAQIACYNAPDRPLAVPIALTQ